MTVDFTLPGQLGVPECMCLCVCLRVHVCTYACVHLCVCTRLLLYNFV